MWPKAGITIQFLTGPLPLGMAPDVPLRPIRMMLMEVPNHLRIQNVLGRDPGAFLWTIALPVNSTRHDHGPEESPAGGGQ